MEHFIMHKDNEHKDVFILISIMDSFGNTHMFIISKRYDENGQSDRWLSGLSCMLNV